MLKLLGKKKPSSPEEVQRAITKEWVPFSDIQRGIVFMKNGEYVKILEVTPINFNLKSKTEKKMIAFHFREFLKANRFFFQTCVQTKAADITPYLERMQSYGKEADNENVRKMILGHMTLTRTLGRTGAVSRRFFLVIPYIKPPGTKKAAFEDVEKQLHEKFVSVRDYLDKCGNTVTDCSDEGSTAFVSKVLYTYLNRRTCETQNFGERLGRMPGLIDIPEEVDEI